MTVIAANNFAPTVKKLDRAIYFVHGFLIGCRRNVAVTGGLYENFCVATSDIGVHRCELRGMARRFYNTTDELTAYCAANDIIDMTKRIEHELAKALTLLPDELKSNLLKRVVDDIKLLSVALRSQLVESMDELDAILTYQWQRRHSS